MCDHTSPRCDHTTAAKLGIELVEAHPDLMPGVLFFGCQRHKATITLETCRRNWDEAHARRGPDDLDRRAACRSCTIGQHLHSTDATDAAEWADVRRPGECVRCARVGLRLVSTTGECVSCWNRRREAERGRNARGRPPMFPHTMTPRRVGLVVDGKPAFRRFLAHHEGEAVSVALRQVDGAKFHNLQPGAAAWNAKAGRFEYRCSKHPGEFGALRELVSGDGTVEYICPVCSPGRAVGLPVARVEAATSIMQGEFMAAACEDAQEVWTPTAHVCDRCEHYPIQVRRRPRGAVEAQCPLCDQE